MKVILLSLLLIVQYGCNKAEDTVHSDEFQNGDIIFQTSTSGQSKAIQLATRSKYSHCGIIYKEGDKYLVFEAIQPVKSTPLEEWIERGEGSHYVVKRLKNADKVLTPQNLQKMKNAGKDMAGKNYDLYFEWSDDRIYCSELIWKVYKKGTGLSVGKIETLKDFELSHPAVKEKLKERYGVSVPLNEKVISPAAIFESELLTTVEEKLK